MRFTPAELSAIQRSIFFALSNPLTDHSTMGDLSALSRRLTEHSVILGRHQADACLVRVAELIDATGDAMGRNLTRAERRELVLDQFSWVGPDYADQLVRDADRLTRRPIFGLLPTGGR